MQHVLSTRLFVNHRLTVAQLDKIQHAGIPAVEIFCARQHLDYRDNAQIAELGHWFRDADLKLHSIHAPMYNDEFSGRSGPQSIITITEPVKGKRLEMVDEIKRALEIAETIPFKYMIQHIGVSGEEYSDRAVDAAFSALEQISLFARQRGVEVLLENIPNALSTAERLMLFLEQTHLDLNFVFDVGHANLGEGVEAAFNIMRTASGPPMCTTTTARPTATCFPCSPKAAPSTGRTPWTFCAPATTSTRCCLELKEAPEFSLPPRRRDIRSIGEFVSAPRITIADAAQHAGETVQIAGWLYNLRKSGKIVFPILRDGTGMIQCVAVKSALPEALFETIKDLTQESSIIVTGKIRAEQRAAGGFEMDVEDVEVVQRVPESDPYPITPKDHGVEFLMDHRHLWLRSQRQHAIIRVRHEIIRPCATISIPTASPSSTPPSSPPPPAKAPPRCSKSITSKTAKPTSPSPASFITKPPPWPSARSTRFGPTFRAEKSKTRRHLTEFWMVEPEMAYATLEDVKRVAEDMLVFVVGRVLENRRPELKVLERDLSKLESIKAPFPRMSYDEAVKILQAKGSEIQWGGDFGGTDETLLSQDFDRPLMVDGYPSAIKAFYMAPDPARPEVALGVDVLAPEGYGEIIGGGQRIHDPELLLRRIEEQKLPHEAFDWYIDLRKYGTVPHGGFGMGIERCVAWLCGLEHIRETIAFPRMLYRLKP